MVLIIGNAVLTAAHLLTRIPTVTTVAQVAMRVAFRFHGIEATIQLLSH